MCPPKKGDAVRKDAGIWRRVGWVPLPLPLLLCVSLSTFPNFLAADLIPCRPSDPKTLTIAVAPPLPLSSLAPPDLPCSSSQAGPPSTASLRSSRISPLVWRMSFLFPTMEEARPRSFASLVRNFSHTFQIQCVWIGDYCFLQVLIVY